MPALSRAGVAVEADGLMIGAHGDPASALSDGAQSLDLKEFDVLMADIKRRVQFEGKRTEIGEALMRAAPAAFPACSFFELFTAQEGTTVTFCRRLGYLPTSVRALGALSRHACAGRTRTVNTRLARHPPFFRVGKHDGPCIDYCSFRC